MAMGNLRKPSGIGEFRPTDTLTKKPIRTPTYHAPPSNIPQKRSVPVDLTEEPQRHDNVGAVSPATSSTISGQNYTSPYFVQPVRSVGRDSIIRATEDFFAFGSVCPAGEQKTGLNSGRPLSTKRTKSRQSVFVAIESRTSKTCSPERIEDPIEDDGVGTGGRNDAGKREDKFNSSSGSTTHARARRRQVEADDIDPLESSTQPGSQSEKLATGVKVAALKRPRDSSADELQVGIDEPSSKRATRPQNHVPVRAEDDSPLKSKKKASVENITGFAVRRALCLPDWTYNTDGDGESLGFFLTFDPVNKLQLLPHGRRKDTQADIGWARVVLGSMTNMSFGLESPIIVCRQRNLRYQGRNWGPTLVLVLKSIDGAQDLVKWARDKACPDITFTKQSSDHLGKVWDAKVEELRSYRANHPPKSTNGGGLEQMQDDFDRSLGKTVMKQGIPLSPVVQTSIAETPQQKSLVDRMLAAAEEEPASASGLNTLDTTRAGRKVRSRKVSPATSPEPVRAKWTVANPGWDRSWKMQLVVERTNIDKHDVAVLDEGEFLNDAVIDFYLKFLHKELRKRDAQAAERIYIFNSFFHSSLRQGGYDSVKKWTAKLNLLSHDYIVVPVNKNLHWYVVLICNPGRLIPVPVPEPDEHQGESAVHVGDGNAVTIVKQSTSPVSGLVEDIGQISIESPGNEKLPISGAAEHVEEKSEIKTIETDHQPESSAPASIFDSPSRRKRKSSKKSMPASRVYDPTEPRIITLDSLGFPHSDVVTLLKKYLRAEIKDKKQLEAELPTSLGMTANGVPQQDNATDCGIYLLAYMRKFMDDPDKFARSLLQKEEIEWTVDAPVLRDEIRDVILRLQRDFQMNVERVQLEKRRKAKAAKQSSPAAAKASSPVKGPELMASVQDAPMTTLTTTAADAATPVVADRSETAPDVIQEAKPSHEEPKTAHEPSEKAHKDEIVDIDRVSPTVVAFEEDALTKVATPTNKTLSETASQPVLPLLRPVSPDVLESIEVEPRPIAQKVDKHDHSSITSTPSKPLTLPAFDERGFVPLFPSSTEPSPGPGPAPSRKSSSAKKKSKHDMKEDKHKRLDNLKQPEPSKDDSSDDYDMTSTIIADTRVRKPVKPTPSRTGIFGRLKRTLSDGSKSASKVNRSKSPANVTAKGPTTVVDLTTGT